MYVFDDHHQKWELDAQCFGLVDGTPDEGSCHIGAHDLKDRRLDILIG